MVQKMAGKFSDSIDTSVDWDSPDEELRKILKKNVWKFSVAKNHNDCIRLSNLLLDDNGKLRSWSEFKKAAQMVVGDSNRYLKTEYNTIIASAQMARLWQEIQRDKHIFPYVQFDVVVDGHTSDICINLDKVIMSVDDPMLLIYFPPNHFNCRTTVRKLRNGKPTEKVVYPDIPEAFKNNVGVNGEIFTNDNSYIANTPKEVFAYSEKHAERWFKYYELQKDKNYEDVAFNMDNLGVKATHKDHSFRAKTARHEKEARDILFEHGEEIIMLSEKAAEGVKTPDATLNGRITDIKTVLGDNGVLGKNNIINKIREGNKQGSEIIVLQFPKESVHFYAGIDMQLQIASAKKLLKQNNQEIVTKEIWVMVDREIIKFSLD